jgi:putative tryptophan/tyrosine transport system substrate-binding protein
VKRRQFISLLGGAAAAWPLAARAQQLAMPVIGLLQLGSPEALANRVGAFRKGLSESGYIEGQNVAIEFRWAHNDVDRLSELAADLVRRRVTLIATPFSMPAALAAKGATTTIPIVFSAAGDPVQTGLVASLNRPGGNVTGVTDFGVALAAKRLGLLHELLPSAARFAVLVNRGVSPSIELLIREVQEAATVIGQQVDVLTAANSHEIDAAFASLLQRHADALMVSPQALFVSRRAQILTQTARHVVPAMYPDREFVEAGGLMSYGSDTFDRERQAGLYAGRVLKGEKPSDLPIMRTTKFELVINLQTAKVLGLEVPPMLLARADEVIE